MLLSFIIYSEPRNSFGSASPLWSCCFSPSIRHQVITGSASGRVSIFDVRSPKAAVTEYHLESNGKKLPIHSLSCYEDVIYASSLDGTYSINSDDGSVKQIEFSSDKKGFVAFYLICLFLLIS